MEFDLDSAIRKVKDFPKKGILFYDLSSILTNPQAFRYCSEKIAEKGKEAGIDMIAAIEARGFLFAAPAAVRLGLPLLIIRKKGKLPGKTITKSFQLEYGEDSIQLHVDDLPKGAKILLVDDLAATGGTLRAAAELIEEAGAEVKEIFSVVGLPFLPYKETLKGYKVSTLINYDSEKA